MSKVRWFAALAIAGCVVASHVHYSAAQEAAPAAPARPAPAVVQYEVTPLLEAVYKDGKVTDATKKIESLVRDVYGGNQPLAQAESSFDKYFTLYVFPKMTQIDDKSLANLPRERQTFIRTHLLQNKRPEVHDHVVQLAYRSLKDVVTKNYHPAVRYNAMLIIGELNSKEAVPAGPSAAVPLPFADALDFMVTQVRDPKQIDAVRVAALVGILRHVDMNAYSQQQYPPQVRQGLIKQMLPLVTEKKAPADRTEEGHAWLRARAVEVIAALGQPAYEASVVQALWTIVGDSKEPFDVRFTAAAALGRLDFRAAANLNGDELARKLADLAVEAAREQLALLDAEIAAEKEKQRLAGTLRTGRESLTRPTTEFYGTIPVNIVKAEQRLTLTQRLLKDRMVKTRLGLQGSEGKTGAITRATKADYIKNVSTAVLALQKVADMRAPMVADRPPTINELAKEMRTQIADLERVAKTGGAPAPPVAAPAAAEGPDEGPDAAPATKKAAPAAEGPEGPDAVAPPAAKKAPAAEGPEEAPAPAPMPMPKKAPADEAPE